MSKKKLALVFILMLLGVGGVFLWQKNQKDVARLNKGLPEGVRVNKGPTKPYEIINKRYGYEFQLPEERMEIWSIEYSESEEMTYTCRVCNNAGILFVGLTGGKGGNMMLESYVTINENINLDTFAQEGNPTWLYKMEVEQSKVGNVNVLKARRKYEWGWLYNYFFRGELNFYRLEYTSEEFIQEIISSGKW